MSEADELSPALPDDVETLAARVLDLADSRDWRLATAESCTGGLLASLLTDVEGKSSAFERGFVTYSIEAKCELLHLARDMVERCNAVSHDVAVAMADGALAASRAQVAVAITGFAGAGGPDDETGLVHFGCARVDGETMHRAEHFGDIGRGPTRIAAVRVALKMFEEALS
ncbi:damage-inducible protein CinA [Sphingomonas spermidinifaciens]|uniref:Damage-inducible protein CinA n=1 Tax=Sphingomonas spermidinifaciens TaxID=1141889 RepID=A0A2A4AXP2_9SPHN|nr:CinA family protein [Sphingomonas spermidinifaciens]PCD01713.1 damage-inducible protein CinA [Sphingomonas spermidinifaciens]